MAQSEPGQVVSGNYFATFGVQPYAGRLLTADDDRSGAAPSAVMGSRLWEEHYGPDPSVIGGRFNMDGKPFSVVGITPSGIYAD